eukprot:m.235580 g.235580  ORF g.235580 m.235580 type:complete len:301 (-) comp26158_c1_seq5:33-935(-)
MSVGGVSGDAQRRSVVGLLVQRQVGLLRRPVVALCAFVRLIPGVAPLVLCNAILPRRPKVAERALKRLLPGVLPQVPCVRTAVLGRVAARGAVNLAVDPLVHWLLPTACRLGRGQCDRRQEDLGLGLGLARRDAPRRPPRRREHCPGRSRWWCRRDRDRSRRRDPRRRRCWRRSGRRREHGGRGPEVDRSGLELPDLRAVERRHGVQLLGPQRGVLGEWHQRVHLLLRLLVVRLWREIDVHDRRVVWWKRERSFESGEQLHRRSSLGVVGVTSKREQRHEPRFATPPHLVPISIVRHSRK